MDVHEKNKPSLKRQLGLLKATSYITGGIVGVGIFIGPAAVLKGAGSSVGVSLTIWIACGLLGYCGCMCYAEFGTRVSKSGGTYTYIREAFGDLPGFVFLWSQLVLTRPLAILLGSLAAAEYIVNPFFFTCFDQAPKTAKLLLGLIILVSNVVTNCYSVTYAAFVQTWATFCKVAVLIVIVIGGIVHMIQGNLENFEDPWRTNSDISVRSIVLAMYVCSYAYHGWDNVTVATEEITNPKRNIPLAIILGFTLVVCVYLSGNVAYHAVLTNAEITSGAAVAVMFGKKLLGAARWIILPFVSISAGGIVNTILFSASRINFVGGRDGLIAEFFSMVNIKRRTPMPSIIVLGIVSIIYMMFGDLVSFMGAYSFYRALGEFAAICGIFRIRRQYPASKKTFVTPTFLPIIYIVVSLTMMCVAIVTEPGTFVPGIIIVLIGVPIYYVSKTKWWKNGLASKIQDNIVNVFQKLFLCDIASKNINEE